MIPQFEQTIRMITMKLEENERSTTAPYEGKEHDSRTRRGRLICAVYVPEAFAFGAFLYGRENCFLAQADFKQTWFVLCLGVYLKGIPEYAISGVAAAISASQKLDLSAANLPGFFLERRKIP